MNYEAGNKQTNKPSDQEFKICFESVSKPPTNLQLPDIVSDVTIPVLDEPINVYEVSREVINVNPDKACGLD